MKKLTCIYILSLISFASCHLHAQSSSPGSSRPSSTQGTGPSNIQRPPLAPPPQKIGPKPPEKGATQTTMPAQKAPQMPSRPTFFQPGIINVQGGVDHLYNIGNNIPVVVEISKSPTVAVNITQESVQAVIEKAFEMEGISPIAKPSDGPSLPFFQVLVMIVPSGNGISAFCSGRVFEKVELNRVALPLGVSFQAITWEYQNLIFAAKEDGDKEITAAIAEIVQQFLSRYRYYKTVAPANQ